MRTGQKKKQSKKKRGPWILAPMRPVSDSDLAMRSLMFTTVIQMVQMKIDRSTSPQLQYLSPTSPPVVPLTIAMEENNRQRDPEPPARLPLKEETQSGSDSLKMPQEVPQLLVMMLIDINGHVSKQATIFVLSTAHLWTKSGSLMLQILNNSDNLNTQYHQISPCASTVT